LKIAQDYGGHYPEVTVRNSAELRGWSPRWFVGFTRRWSAALPRYCTCHGAAHVHGAGHVREFFSNVWSWALPNPSTSRRHSGGS